MKDLTDKQNLEVAISALIAFIMNSTGCGAETAASYAGKILTATEDYMFPEASHEQANPTR